MKRLTLVASIFVLAACATKETQTVDSSAAAAPAMTPAPAPAATDSAAAAPTDSTMKHDSTKM
jgi:uncharacterized lipoprotein YajG